MTKLAITIPYFKKRFFDQTLKSIINQTDKRFTLYIGNDNSPENPEDLIEKYIKNSDINYKYINYKENVGGTNLALQWERVIAETYEEDWIMILGDDDYLSTNVVEEFYKVLPEVDENNLNLIKFSQQLIDDDNKKFSFRTKHPKIYPSTKFLVDKTNGDTRNSISENIFRKSIYEKYKFKKYPLAWGSDDMAWLQFSEFKNFYFVENATFYIHSGNYNLSGNSEVNKDIKAKGATLLYKDIILDYNKFFSKSELFTFLKYYENTSRNFDFPIEINLPKYYFKYDGLRGLVLSIRRILLYSFKQKKGN